MNAMLFAIADNVATAKTVIQDYDTIASQYSSR